MNIGEGRGYANYSWKIVATYDKPVPLRLGHIVASCYHSPTFYQIQPA